MAIFAPFASRRFASSS